MNIFNEILWPQFVQLNDIKGLPLNEQVIKYNQYLNELAYNRKCYLQQINCLPHAYYIIELSADLKQQQQALLTEKMPEFVKHIYWLEELPENKLNAIMFAFPTCNPKNIFKTFKSFTSSLCISSF